MSIQNAAGFPECAVGEINGADAEVDLRRAERHRNLCGPAAPTEVGDAEGPLSGLREPRR